MDPFWRSSSPDVNHAVLWPADRGHLHVQRSVSAGTMAAAVKGPPLLRSTTSVALLFSFVRLQRALARRGFPRFRCSVDPLEFCQGRASTREICDTLVCRLVSRLTSATPERPSPLAAVSIGPFIHWNTGGPTKAPPQRGWSAYSSDFGCSGSLQPC